MSTIKTGTTSTTGYVVEADTTGAFVVQTGTTPTTALSISASGVVTFPATTTIGTLYFGAGTVTDPSISTTGDANTGIYFPGADQIAITTGGTQKLFVGSSVVINEPGADVDFRVEGDTDANLIFADASTDQVAIGTSTTIGKLTVNDTNSGQTQTAIAMRNGGTGDNSGVRLAFRGVLNTSAEADYGYINFVANDTTNRKGYISFSTADGAGPSERVRIVADGSVGIGTNDPNYKLHVTTNIAVGASGFNQQLILGNNSIQSQLLGTGYTNMSIQALGANLGVGTASPTAKLHVWQTGATTSLNIDGIENPIFAARYAANADGATIFLAKSRNATVGSQTIVQNGDELGVLKARGSNGSSFVDAASITFAVDGTPGSGSDMPGRIVFGTSSDGTASITERVRITSDGNVGIGTTSPGTSRLSLSSSAATTLSINGVAFSSAISAKCEASDGGAIFFGSVTTHDLRFLTNNSHQGSILGSTGEYIIGDGNTTALSSDRIHSIGSTARASLSSGAYARLVMQERTSNWISFVNGSGTHFGTIAVSGSGVSYGSNSDYRLKENVVDLNNAINRVKQLKPKRFNFINNPSVTQDGFLAHEVQDVVPEAVIGDKDGYIATGNVVDADGKIVKLNVEEPKDLEKGTQWVQTKSEPKYQTLDASFLVPLLTKAIQEAAARIEKLESEMVTLKGLN